MKKKQLKAYQYAKQIWWFSSIKNSNRQWCESLLERDYLLSLEFDDDVQRYLSQPASIVYQDLTGKPRRYTPDTLVRTTSGDSLSEVKPSLFVSLELENKISHINSYLYLTKSPEINIVTDDSFHDGDRIKNLNFLYVYRQVNIERCYESELIPKLLDGISYKDLLSLTEELNQNEVISIAMIAHGILTFDHSKLLVPLTYLEFNHDKYRAI
jgi:hypothetical protein